jgi:hypothetical protein
MPSFREVSQGMYGAWRLARFDPAAMAWFNRSIEGVWHSFWAAVIAYPAFIILLALKIAPEQWAASGVLRILLVQSIGYVIAWVAFPLVILPFCRWLERDDQCLVFIIAYNWSQVLQVAATLAVAALAAAAILPGPLMSFVEFATEIALLVYEWYIARTALEAGGVAATAVVLLDLVLAFGMGEVTQGLY